jgi:hypothetical protein
LLVRLHLSSEMTTPLRPPLDWSGNAPFPGFSRESKIRLDGEGRFWHDGERVDHPGLARGLHTWIGRHPNDGRIVLENGWDWCYLAVDDAPYFVRGVSIERGAAQDPGERLVVRLSDESAEPLVLESLRVDAQGAIRCEVKHAAKGGPFAARFDRHAAAALGELLHEVDGRVVLRVGGNERVITSA